MIASFATLLVVRNLRWAQEVIPLQQPQGLREPRQKEDVQGCPSSPATVQTTPLGCAFIHSFSLLA